MKKTDKIGVSLHCKIDEALSQKLSKYSRTSGLTRTAIVERAIEEYLSRQLPTELRDNYLNHE